jgi:hypothetical protein
MDFNISIKQVKAIFVVPEIKFTGFLEKKIRKHCEMWNMFLILLFNPTNSVPSAMLHFHPETNFQIIIIV